VDDTGLFHASTTPGQGTLNVEIAGTRTAVPVVIGTQTGPLDSFEQPGLWTASTTPPGVPGSLTLAEATPPEGRRCLRLEYDFRAGQGTRAVYANTKLPLGQPLALRLWVRGDGGSAWLRARLRDAQGHAQLLTFSRHLGRLGGWQELTAPLPPGLPGPLTLEALYLVETDPQAQPKGAIELAGLAGDYAPSGRR
jgi:hypothetical protein